MPQSNNPAETAVITKVEILAEAIESFCIATVDRLLLQSHINPVPMVKTPELIAVNCDDARRDLVEAVRDILKPTIRVVERERSVGEAKETLRVTTASR